MIKYLSEKQTKPEITYLEVTNEDYYITGKKDETERRGTF